MFNKKFCETKGKKVIHQGGARGNRGTVQIALGSVISVFIWISKYITWDIQAITTFLGLLLVLYVLLPSIYSFFNLTTTLLKSDIFTHSSLCSPQLSTYRHRTGFSVKRKQVRITNYPGVPINCSLYF